MNNKINKLDADSKSRSQSSDTKQVHDSKLEVFLAGLKPLIESKTEIVVLQHPQEKREDLATVPILARYLPKAIVKVGLSWPNLKKILGREVNSGRWAVIYLGTQSESQKYLDSKVPVSMIGKEKHLSALEGIVVLDGSWREAKTLWWRNAWLLKLNRIVLNPGSPAIYNALRKEPRRESVSTLEAVAMVLAEIEKRPEIYEELTAPLKKLIVEVGAGKTHRKLGAKRDWRRRKR